MKTIIILAMVVFAMVANAQTTISVSTEVINDETIISIPPGGLVNGCAVYQVIASDPDGDRLLYQIMKGNSGSALGFGYKDPAGINREPKDYTGVLYVRDIKAVKKYMKFDLLVRVTDPGSLFCEAHVIGDFSKYFNHGSTLVK